MDFYEEIEKYKNNLLEQNLTVVFSRAHLAKMIDHSYVGLSNLLDSPRANNYRLFRIEKRKGGLRELHSPTPQLKIVQQSISELIFSKCSISEHAHGFVPNRSTLTCAQVHLGQESLLKLDISNFFGSITGYMVNDHLRKIGYATNLCIDISKLVTIDYLNGKANGKSGYFGVLPQGAPSSPVLSNIIFNRVDSELSKLSSKYNVKYSRYADDITFSGSHSQLKDFPQFVKPILKKYNFKLNFKKTCLIRRGGRFEILGLRVDDSVARLPNRYKKKIEHHLYHCKTNGVNRHILNIKSDKRNFKDWLLGHIMYSKSIDQEFGNSCLSKFKDIYWPI